MKDNNLDIEIIRKRFFALLQQEYDLFKNYIMKQSIDKVYGASLKITFYREMFDYLNADVLQDDEYRNFVDEKIIEKLWDVYVVSELPRQTRDYLRQLIKLHKDNKARKGA